MQAEAASQRLQAGLLAAALQGSADGRHTNRASRIGGGIALIGLGAMGLWIPFINLSVTSAISVSTAHTLCNSGIGTLFQAGSQTIAADCGEVSVGFFGSWAFLAAGVGLFSWGCCNGWMAGLMDPTYSLG
jgi:hypothetical protein